MTAKEPTQVYIYQPYGTIDSDPLRRSSGRLWGVGGVNMLTIIKGLTKQEARVVAHALNQLHMRARRGP